MPNANTLRTSFEEYLNQYPSGTNPKGLYEPVTYALLDQGKRIRPVLVLLAYRLFKDDHSRALPAALAIEYFHTFTLIHDDIMDAATLRRGKPTVQSKFGTNAAILSGDLMLIRSFDLLLASSNERNTHKILGEFSDTAVQICEGQQLDMDFEKRDAVSVPEYLQMVEKKTAVLLGCALLVGAIIADAPFQQAESLNDIGILLGKAFQIQDDILDAYGEVHSVGKRRGGDILQKKKSILYALAYESLNVQGRTNLAELYNKEGGNPEVKIQQVLSLFQKLNVCERALELETNLVTEAMELLDNLSVSGEPMVALRDFIQSLLNRNA